MSAQTPPSGPLDGLRVLDLTRLQPGNYATLLLGDLGADVIKVEEPGRGDYVRWTPPVVGEMSAAHRVLNRNKRSVTLNLKKQGASELLRRMTQGADILVESFRPGVMDRLGVGYETLSAANDGLIYCAITGYGQTGPYRDRAGHDINYIATSGVLGATGTAGGDPVLPSVQVADLGGALMALVGVLAALHRRSITGKGEFVDVGMMDVSLSWLALHLAPWLAGGPSLKPGEGYLNGGYPFYRVYRCADGGHMSVGALEPQFWSALCKALDLPELIDDQFAPEPRRAEIHSILEGVFARKSASQWAEGLANVEACVAMVNDFAQMADDPQVKARSMMDLSDDQWNQLGIPVQLRNVPGTLRLGAPGLGEHNAQVYSELGLSSDDVARLGAEGVI